MDAELGSEFEPSPDKIDADVLGLAVETAQRGILATGRSLVVAATLPPVGAEGAHEVLTLV